MEKNDSFDAIRRGLLELLVLKIIASGQVYSADILRMLDTTEFKTQEGTLYPLLSKMRREGFLDYEWRETENGPPRKYYRLTAEGRGKLDDLMEYWQLINTTIKNTGK